MNDGYLGNRGNTFQRFPDPYTVYNSWSQAAGRGAVDVTAAEIMRDFPSVEDVIHSTEGRALIANLLLCPPPIDDDFLDFNVACSYSEGTYCVIVILSHCKINHNEGGNLFLNESIFFTASTLTFCYFADTKMIVKRADTDKATMQPKPLRNAVAGFQFITCKLNVESYQKLKFSAVVKFHSLSALSVFSINVEKTGEMFLFASTLFFAGTKYPCSEGNNGHRECSLPRAANEVHNGPTQLRGLAQLRTLQTQCDARVLLAIKPCHTRCLHESLSRWPPHPGTVVHHSRTRQNGECEFIVL